MISKNENDRCYQVSAIPASISENKGFVNVKSNIDRCEVACSEINLHSSLSEPSRTISQWFWDTDHTGCNPLGEKLRYIFSEAVFVRLGITVRFGDVMVQLLEHLGDSKLKREG
jgi:hypothetical protein